MFVELAKIFAKRYRAQNAGRPWPYTLNSFWTRHKSKLVTLKLLKFQNDKTS